MNLQLKRVHKDATATSGVLYVDGKFECYTLELPNPIPAGVYDLLLTVSGRAMNHTLWTPDPQFRLPELMNVPNYTAIRIHAGNTVANTQGCILVGLSSINDTLYQSRTALTALMSKLTGNDRIEIS